MRKRSLVLFVLLFVFWIAVSAEVDVQHIIFGVLVASITVWFWHDLDGRLPDVPSIPDLMRLGHCLVLLIGYIIQSNIAVAKTLLFSRPSAKPMFVVMEPNLKSNWGRVFLAICITITPGTVTVDIDPETGRFIIHALTEETAKDILYWRLIDKIIKLETKMERGDKHAMDNGWDNGLNSTSATTGNNRSDSY